MEPESGDSLGSRAEPWIALALCAAVLAAGALNQLARSRPAEAGTSSPPWIPLGTTALAAAGIMRLNDHPLWLRVRRSLHWTAFLLMVWTAQGLPLDWLRLTPLMPFAVDWPGLATKTLALAAAVGLARLALARPAEPAPTHAIPWYGWAAFVLALPYPVLRTSWALGGTLGLARPGAAGHGWLPWLACIPWLLAAVLSLLLVPTWRWLPRRPLLAAGWSATALVALIGPGACWALVTKLFAGADLGLREHGIATWVPALFYGSWLLWAIAAGAATHSYQSRTAALRTSSPG
jgi:hypothetical protein